MLNSTAPTPHGDDSMTPQDWQRIKAITAAALEQPEAARRPYVADTCGDDTGLQREVLSLLSCAIDASRMFEAPLFPPEAVAEALARATPQCAIAAGMRIGPWRIVRELGRGGMGAVFLAERADDEYRQR